MRVKQSEIYFVVSGRNPSELKLKWALIGSSHWETQGQSWPQGAGDIQIPSPLSAHGPQTSLWHLDFCHPYSQISVTSRGGKREGIGHRQR